MDKENETPAGESAFATGVKSLFGRTRTRLAAAADIPAVARAREGVSSAIQAARVEVAPAIEQAGKEFRATADLVGTTISEKARETVVDLKALVEASRTKVAPVADRAVVEIKSAADYVKGRVAAREELPIKPMPPKPTVSEQESEPPSPFR